MKIYEITEKLDALFPLFLREEWDNDGEMLVLDKTAEVTGVLTTLDVTDEAVEEAIKVGANLIISHHPMIFKGISAMTDTPLSRRIARLIKADISVLSYHTRFDTAEGGMNDRLAKILGLKNVRSFGLKGENDMARIGEIEECTPDIFAKKTARLLDTEVILYEGKRRIKTVAVIGGGGKDFIHTAHILGADAILTGDVSYSVVNEEMPFGITVVDGGHFATEKIAVEIFAEILKGMNLPFVHRFLQKDYKKFITKE